MSFRLLEFSPSLAANYASDLDSARYEKAKRLGKKSALKRGLRRLENVLAVGNWLFRAVRTIERHWRAEVIEGRTPYDPEEERLVADYLRQWCRPCHRCRDEIESFRLKGLEVRGSRRFEKYCAEAQDILEGGGPFFDDAEKAGRWAALTAEHRQSPRPVRIDEEGRIFEVTGERFLMPGLTPDEVREGISDVNAGRTRPLKEIIAARNTHEL
jgi:hypothetical protein